MAEKTLTVTHNGQALAVVRHKPAYTHIQVPSSKPDRDPYDVIVDKHGARCTCKGYMFRTKCRHSRLAKNLVGQA